MAPRKSRDIDRGWAWIVLIAAFMNLLIGPGLAFVGGLFQATFLEHFQESVAITSWVTSLFASLMQLAGPASGFLSSQTSCRVSVVSGAVLLAIGLFAGSFVNSIQLLLVFMGIIAGIGLGLTYSASIVIVNLYFVKMRNLVTGVALSATGAGCLIMPLLVRHLLDVFSWRETLSVLAGVSLQMAVCGALMFPIHEQNNKLVLCRFCQNSNENTLQGKKDDLDIDLENYPPLPKDNRYQTKDVEDNEKDAMLVENDIEQLKDGQHDIESDLEERSFFTNRSFLILCLNLFLSNAACGIYLIHFPSFALRFPVSPADVAFSMSMNGPFLAISRILLGTLGNDEKTDPLAMYIGVLLTGSVVICITPLLATTSLTQSVVMAVLGLYFGGSYSFITAITIDCVGVKKLASAFGWEMICAGSGYLVAPPIAGVVVDKTGEYSNSLYLSGGLLCFSAVVIMMVPLCRRRKAANPLRHHQDATIDVKIKETDQSTQADNQS